MGLVDVALQVFQAIARPANQKSKAGKGQPVDEQHVQHAWIDGSASAHDRLRMLGAEEPDREVNERHTQRAQNRKGGRQRGCLSAAGLRLIRYRTEAPKLTKKRMNAVQAEAT